MRRISEVLGYIFKKSSTLYIFSSSLKISVLFLNDLFTEFLYMHSCSNEDDDATVVYLEGGGIHAMFPWIMPTVD